MCPILSVSPFPRLPLQIPTFLSDFLTFRKTHSKMATNLLPLRPITIRPCSASGPQKPDPNRRKSTSKWWTPLFGMSSEPDYIGGSDQNKTASEEESKESRLDSGRVRSRFAPGCFTEEKAKQLRMLTTESFHDAMYHSAIASRLASDFKDRSDL